jgi:hypothetical protein
MRECVKDADGNIVELRCSYDPATAAAATRRPQGEGHVIHWVSAATRDAECGSTTACSDSKPGRLVFNRTITLRDTWAKLSAQA